MTDPLILFGGTFDPPHMGHLVLADSAQEKFGGSVLFLPAGDPWRKTSRVVASAAHRLAMTELAADTNPNFAVDAREVNRSGPSFTVDTLDAFRAEGYQRIVLILGSDALADLPNWKEPDRIREMATLAVASREGRPAPDRPGVIPVSMPTLDISSTMIRGRIAAGHTVRYLVPGAVRDYITHHRLYR